MNDSTSSAIGWIIVAAFAVTFVITILGLIGKVKIQRSYMNCLFGKMVLEVIAAGFFLFYQTPERTEDLVDVSGKWAYTASQQGLEYTHFGTATIQQQQTPYGVVLKINGKRKWKKENEGQMKIPYEPPVDWESVWGVLGADNGVRFEYRMYENKKNIRGFAVCKLDTSGGTAESMSGLVYLLPPRETKILTLSFKRMKSKNGDPH